MSLQDDISESALKHAMEDEGNRFVLQSVPAQFGFHIGFKSGLSATAAKDKRIAELEATCVTLQAAVDAYRAQLAAAIRAVLSVVAYGEFRPADEPAFDGTAAVGGDLTS